MKKYLIIPALLFSFALLAQQQGIDSLKTAISEIDEDTIRVQALIDLANECRYYYPDEIRQINEQALEISEESDYTHGRGLALKGMGKFFADRKEYDSAMYYYRQAELIFNALGNKKELSNVVGNYCYMCIAQGEYNEALDAGFSALQFAEESNDKTEIQNAFSFIGTTYCSLGNKEKAIEYLNLGLEIAILRKDNMSIASIKGDLAMVYDEFQEYEKAIIYYREAAELLQNMDDLHSLGIAEFNLAEVYRCQKQYKKAIRGYFESYIILSELNDFVGSSSLLLKMGGAYVALLKQNHDVTEANQFIKKMGFTNINDLLTHLAKQLEESNSKKDLLTNLEILAELNTLNRNYQTAYNYNVNLITLKDTLAKSNTAMALAEMLTRFEIQQKEKQIELLETQTLANENKISVQRQQQLMILIIGFLLLVFGFGLRSRIQIIRKRKEILQTINEKHSQQILRAERSEKFKEQFLTNVSHEIRTPMNAIIGITNILIKNNHKVEQEKYLEAINISSRHLLKLINSILNLSKLESGKYELEKVGFNIKEVLSKIEEEVRPEAEAKSLYFNLTIADNIPDRLLGDETLLLKILRDMCFNSLEFTKKGGLSIQCGLNALTEKIAIVGFVVKDTGIGIQKSIHHKIFNSLIREVAFDKMQFDHSGLELVIIKQMLELQGGTITLDSDTGKGAVFHFEIPYEIPLEEKEKDSEPEEELKKPLDINSISILLVEDNDFNVMVATEELEDAIENVRIDVASNGEIAVDKVRNNSYNVILMDIQMPVLNGYDATKAIRLLENEKSKIPIIAMTANIMESEVQKCYEAGMDAYVSKPFNIDELVAVIWKNINRSQNNK